MSTVIYAHNASTGKVVKATTPLVSTGVIKFEHDQSTGKVKRTDS